MQYLKTSEQVKNNLKNLLPKYLNKVNDNMDLNQTILVETCLEKIIALDQSYQNQLQILTEFNTYINNLWTNINLVDADLINSIELYDVPPYLVDFKSKLLEIIKKTLKTGVRIDGIENLYLEKIKEIDNINIIRLYDITSDFTTEEQVENKLSLLVPKKNITLFRKRGNM